MSLITEIQESGMTFNSGANSGAGTGNVGTWTFNTNIAYSGGNSMSSSTSGDSVTINFTGRALYLCVKAVRGTAASFAVTLDGVSLPNNFSSWTASQYANQVWYRYLIPVVRGAVDTSHTVVITVGSGGGVVDIDSAIAISGNQASPSTGVYVALGDSWTFGTGATNTSLGGFAPRLQQLLEAILRRQVTLTNSGIPGDRLYGQDNTKIGGLYRMTSVVVPATPEFLTVIYGPNDLIGGGINADWSKVLTTLLCLIEDTLDVKGTVGTAVKVAVATPGWVSPADMLQSSYAFGAATANAAPYLIDGWEMVVQMTHMIVAQFPWCRLACVFEAMDYRTSLVYPNAAGDVGNHPNDTGHGVIATEFARALMGVIG